MKAHRLQAHINIQDIVFFNFIWYGTDKFYNQKSLNKLAEVIPKEAVKKDQIISVIPEIDSIGVKDCISINFSVDDNDLFRSKKYYLAICQFFKIEESCQEKIWGELIETVDDTSKVLVNCIMKESFGERSYEIEIQKLKSETVFKINDDTIYRV